jgi:ABC-type arginine transport system ATPase subunit
VPSSSSDYPELSPTRHLAEQEPQVVVLDDPCVHVSRERTARLVDLLNNLTANGHVQVVVLTHPQGEFAGLMGSEVNVAAL